MQCRNKLFSVLAAVVLLPLAAQADTTYDIAFTDMTSPATFSNASGTFTVNSAGQVTDLNVTFTVETAFSYSDGIYPAGTQLVFGPSTITSIGPTNFDPVTGIFSRTGFEVVEVPPSNDGAYVDLGGALGNTGYDIGPWVAPFGFNEPIDFGTYTIGPATPPSVPEPTSAALIFLGISGAGLIGLRKHFART